MLEAARGWRIGEEDGPGQLARMSRVGGDVDDGLDTAGKEDGANELHDSRAPAAARVGVDDEEHLGRRGGRRDRG